MKLLHCWLPSNHQPPTDQPNLRTFKHIQKHDSSPHDMAIVPSLLHLPRLPNSQVSSEVLVNLDHQSFPAGFVQTWSQHFKALWVVGLQDLEDANMIKMGETTTPKIRFYGSNARIILLKSIVPKENHMLFIMMIVLMLMMLMYDEAHKHVYKHIISVYTHTLYTHIYSIIGNKHILFFQWDLVFTIPWAIPNFKFICQASGHGFGTALQDSGSLKSSHWRPS